MKHVFALLFLLLPLAVLAENEKKEQHIPVQQTPMETLTTFQGTIGDVSNYEPLKDVVLTIMTHDGNTTITTKTDAEGRFAIRDIPEGIYKVRFEKNGYEPGNYQSLTVKSGASNNFGFLLFEK